MKKQIYRLTLIMVPIMLLFSCSKDKFSEKDALDSQQKVDLLVTVIDASSSLAPVQGATVKVVVDSTVVSHTTNANGTTVFTGVNIGGDITVSVSKANFTSVMTTVWTGTQSYRQTQVSKVISLYSLDPTKIATISGRLTMQSDLTDRNREVAAGVIVKARNNSLNSTTEQLFTATTDADGKYSISVPVSSSGNDIYLFYPEFTVNQKLAFVQQDKSVAVAERSVLYNSDSRPSNSLLLAIPAIPSIYATVAAPATTHGTGFALGSKPNKVSLNVNCGLLLIDGGAGYNGGVSINNYQLSFSPGASGGIAEKLYVDIVNGKITNIVSYVNVAGAVYNAPPTLLVPVGVTTPANIAIGFQTNYKIYVSNKGVNYIVFPKVSVETETYSSGGKVKAVDPDINDGSNNPLGINYLLTSRSVILGGVIKAAFAGDTLIAVTTNTFSSAPIFTVTGTTGQRAVLSMDQSYIGTDSTMTAINLVSGGFGYDPASPPVVTLTTLAGYGTGAVAKATVNTSGSVSAIYITNAGKKYVKNVNDYKNTGITGFVYDEPSYPDHYYSGVKPGDKVVQDVYYGTGYNILNQNFNK